jgi:hypothetical protein
MSNEQPKLEIASDTYKTANAALALENAQLKNTCNQLKEEFNAVRTQLEQANSIIENDLKSDLIIKIQAASEYTESDLLLMNPSQLQTIEETLSKSKGFASNAKEGVYKSIRAGNASMSNSNLTVGDLYGKTAKEIQAMGGNI